MANKKVSMQDVADSLGISKVTVFKALSGKKDISEALKEQIIQKCAALDYNAIDPLAKFSRTFYFLFPRQFYISTEQYYFGIYKKLFSLFESIGLKLEVRFIHDDFDSVKFVENNKRLGFSNFGIFIAGQASSALLQSIADMNIPCVCIDYYSDKYKLNYIYIDNYRAGYHLTNYLIANGHRKICFIIDINTATTNMDKYYGFRKSLHKNNIAFNDSMHINLNLAKNNRLLDLALPEGCTAFILDCDQSAYNLCSYLNANGKKIPDDFSVISFDNTELSLETMPPLTSMGPQIDPLIQTCYELMLKTMQKPLYEPRAVTFFSTLHVRGSVKNIAAEKGKK